MDEIEPGVYTWIVATDLHYGDSMVATLFGLKSQDTQRGLPVARYLERIHIEDRAGVSRLIAKAVSDGQPFYAEYRVVGAKGLICHVIDIGRCYYHSNGMPHLCSGIVYPVSQLDASAFVGTG